MSTVIKPRIPAWERSVTAGVTRPLSNDEAAREAARLYTVGVSRACRDLLANPETREAMLIELAKLGFFEHARTVHKGIDAPYTHNAVESFEHEALCRAFTTEIIARMDRRRDLIRISATAPRGRDIGITALMRDFADTLGRLGMSAWLCLDIRKQRDVGGEHVYGLIDSKRNMHERIVREWIAISGADPAKGVKLKTLVGWDDYAARGDSSMLQTSLFGKDPGANVHGCVSYGLKPLPKRRRRDLDTEVITTDAGALRDAWRASYAPTPAPGGETPSVTPLRDAARPVTAPRLCPVCNERALTARQTSACSVACRVEKHRRGKR